MYRSAKFSIRRSFQFPATVLLVCLCTWGTFTTAACAEDSWPQWRGPQQNGVANGAEFPTAWDESSGIVWSIDIPGRGSSTPVIDSGHAFLTSGHEGQNTLTAVDLEDGAVKWQATIGEDRGNKHKKGGGSNPSAVASDGLIYAYFRSGDLACVNLKGEVVWQTNLQSQFGEDTLWWDLGSSPLLTETAVIVTVMQTGPSYLAAFDRDSGDLLWKADRNLGAPEEAAQSYATPVNVSVNGQPLIAVMGADHLTVHTKSGGQIIGKLGGFNPTSHKYFRSISSPVAAGNVVICPYARGATLTAVAMDKLIDGAGEDAILWMKDDFGSDVPTPAIYGDQVLVVSDGKQTRGTIASFDLNSGTENWSLRIPKSRISYSSSPLVAGDHLYVTAENGTTHVIGPLSSEQPSIVSSNELDDDEQFTTASPVPVQNGLLIRTKNKLYRVKG